MATVDALQEFTLALFIAFNPEGRGQEVEALAPIVWEEALKQNINPYILAAVVTAESGFHPEARGERGEIGLGQLKRRTLATRGYEHFTNKQLAEPRLNLRLAARHLAHAQNKCKGPPARWLSRYNGRKCGLSRYSRKIVHIAKRLEKLGHVVVVIESVEVK